MTTDGPALQTRAYGKWILAGEHAVLRGCPALVFPMFGKSLTLSYAPAGGPLSAEFTGPRGEELNLLFWGVMERALQMTGHNRDGLTGRMVLENNIPVGGGLGASAALCVSIARWCIWNDLINESDLYEFSRQLENLFHGESSGVDIAVAISARGLHFERGGERYELEPKWKPRWYLSYSGQRGVTSECVNRVKELWDRDRRAGERLDEAMRASVVQAEEALCAMDPEAGLERLIESIRLARSCFDQWGLTSGEIGEHMKVLERHGAAAVKPTGSGGGGYVLSLWRETPPAELRSAVLVPVDR